MRVKHVLECERCARLNDKIVFLTNKAEKACDSKDEFKDLYQTELAKTASLKE